MLTLHTYFTFTGHDETGKRCSECSGSYQSAETRATTTSGFDSTSQSSLPKDLAALRIVQSDTIENPNKTIQDVHAFLETTTTTLEITGHGDILAKEGMAFNASGTQVDSCTRCGRDNHTQEECYASHHKNGTKLHTPKARKPPNKKGHAHKATKGSTQGADSKPTGNTQTLEEYKSDLKKIEIL